MHKYNQLLSKAKGIKEELDLMREQLLCELREANELSLEEICEILDTSGLALNHDYILYIYLGDDDVLEEYTGYRRRYERIPVSSYADFTLEQLEEDDPEYNAKREDAKAMILAVRNHVLATGETSYTVDW